MCEVELDNPQYAGTPRQTALFELYRRFMNGRIDGAKAAMDFGEYLLDHMPQFDELVKLLQQFTENEKR